jgi:acetolactate synthase-1/2/3 large subunit
MTKEVRGADIVALSLARVGCRQVFTLSGNHIMSVFDAAIEAKLDLVHVRHEAAAVHMADAFGRLTGEPGVALVTGGPGHANAVGALFTALGAESPMVLLSGHAATWELGRGGFQELRQADMAAPVAKASWTATSVAGLAGDIGEAIRIAKAGRPGPVHVSLPSDLLDARIGEDAIAWPDAEPTATGQAALSEADATAILAALGEAERPLILAGPAFAHCGGRELLSRLEQALLTPCAILESPRGMADATLGALRDLAPRADLVMLLGKALDFTSAWLSEGAFDPKLRVIAVDPEPALIERARTEMKDKLRIGCVAAPRGAAATLVAEAASGKAREPDWLADARQALDERPQSWATLTAATPGTLHPAEVFRTLRPYIERDPQTVLICDGGEFAQWGQSMLPARRRLTNSVTGAIGCSLPFALTARLVEQKAPVFAVLGDGTVGFHLAEFETAARRNLPFVAIVGNDARWNAESQIQIREYGQNRMHGCELLPARYDLAVAALGGHGELVERAVDLPQAIERALGSGKPACINVMIESTAAPALRRPAWSIVGEQLAPAIRGHQ